MPVFYYSSATTLASDLVEETRAYLYGGQEEEMNELTGDIDNVQTSWPLVFAVGSMSQRGCIISIDLEDIRVWQTDGSNTITQCMRGVNGTAAATHTLGTPIFVRTKFSYFRIMQKLNEEMLSLSAPANGMFAEAHVDVTYNAAIQGYDLTDINTATAVTDIIRVLEARYKVPGPSRNWPQIRRFSLQRDMDTTVFPSGLVFDVYQRGWPGLPIHIRYASPYGQMTALTDNVSAKTGLQPTAFDIVPMGAAVRLVYGREIKRNFTEAGLEPRRMEEVPPGAVLRSPGGLALLRAQRIKEEAGNLQQRWPWYSEAV
jgi:hypothetical protein